MCFICGILAAIYQGAFNTFKNINFTTVIENSGNSNANQPEYVAFTNFLRCMIIFQNIVPIALYISIDVAKTLQVRNIYSYCIR